jgi:hypothetical protein
MASMPQIQIIFINSCTVHRAWDDGSNELLAGFQYETYAIEFAKAKLAYDAGRNSLNSYYVVHETCAGKMTIVRHKPDTVET